MHGNFIWSDLSTYKTAESLEFYQAIFRWNFTALKGYHLGSVGSDPIVGIYETPAFFQKINMPHFWMNYIQVEDVNATADLAASLGGKVELRNEVFAGGAISLIRDPKGAGFTVYQGSELSQPSHDDHGTVLSRELHYSDIGSLLDFYGQLFNWNYKKSIDGSNSVLAGKKKVAKFRELSNAEKGQYEYWVTIFLVDNLDSTYQEILRLGGHEISHEGDRIMMTDPLVEAFFYIQSVIKF